MGRFVPRLTALTVIWLLATAALTYAAAHRIGTVPAATTTTQASAPSAAQVLVVPDVRREAYVFAEGTLGDGGFGWRVDGAVHGFASNTVVTQLPSPGTRVIDTGFPTIVLHLGRSGKEAGIPQDSSPNAGTALKLAELATAPVRKPAAAVTAKPAAKPAATTTTQAPAKTISSAAKPKPKPKAPGPKSRPPAFAVVGARREPLDEIPLDVRASHLLRWVDGKPKPTDANVRYWLYQHAWIVTGARMGWWHGTDALHTLVTVDGRVWDLWGIGERSAGVAKQALTYVKGQSA